MNVRNKNRNGYKKTKVGWIPKDWECVCLGRVFERRVARGAKGIPVFSVTQDRGLVGRDALDRRVETKLSPEDSLLVEPGDIAYNMMRMWQGAVDVCSEPCVVSPAYIVCRPRADLASSTFMLLFFKSPTGLYKLWSYSYGVVDDRLRLYFKDFRHVPAPLPCLPEQEAIAGVLECWDKAIQNYEKKIKKKRNIKKGLMQRLFSGKQRLPGFAGEWKEVVLKDVLAQKPKYGINAAAVPYAEDLPTYLRITDISEYGRFLSDGVVSVNSTRSEEYYLNLGDLVFARTGASTGKTYLYTPNDGQLVFAGFLIKVTPDPSRLLPQFLKFYTETDTYWKWVSVMCLRSGQPGINGNEYARLDLRLPSVPEQQAIAAVLSAADFEIEAMERKLALLKEQKKFLLNNLVTGIIRLPQFRGGMTNAGAHGDQV